MTAGSVLHVQIIAHMAETITFKCMLMKHFKAPPQALGILMSCYDDNIDDDEL